MTVITVEQLAAHAGHNVEVEVYVDEHTNATVTCLTCDEILISFDDKSGRDACPRCEVGSMHVVQWLPDAAADAGYYEYQCDNCLLTRREEIILPDDDEWADEQDDEDEGFFEDDEDE